MPLKCDKLVEPIAATCARVHSASLHRRQVDCRLQIELICSTQDRIKSLEPELRNVIILLIVYNQVRTAVKLVCIEKKNQLTLL